LRSGASHVPPWPWVTSVSPLRPCAQRVQKRGTKTLSVDYRDCSRGRRARDAPGRNHETSGCPTMRCPVRETVNPSNSAWMCPAVDPCVPASDRAPCVKPSSRQICVDTSNRATCVPPSDRAPVHLSVKRCDVRWSVKPSPVRSTVAPSNRRSQRPAVSALAHASDRRSPFPG